MTATELHGKIIAKLESMPPSDSPELNQIVRGIANLIFTQWKIKVRAKEDRHFTTMHINLDVNWYVEMLRGIAIDLGIPVK